MNAAHEFDICGPLPLEGRLSIEASAGTGKTFALTGLAVRYIAEAGIGIDRLLMVTFGRLAAMELRERVRERLVATAKSLTVGLVDGDLDPVIQHLSGPDRDLHRRRILRAIVRFDAAMITTTHSFAQQVRSMLGSQAALNLDAVLRDDTDEIVNEVVSDVLASSALGTLHGAHHLATPKQAWFGELTSLAKAALSNPGIVIAPKDGELHDISTMAAAQLEASAKRSLLSRILSEVDHRRRLRNTLSYDDILTHLRDALIDHPEAVVALRSRFLVALIDEFQDTDPVQWDIVDRVFGREASGTALVLVGDPKQAIYGFRGANVYTYLNARDSSENAQRELSVNYRSDAALLTGLDRLFSRLTLGHPAIAFHHVRPSPEHLMRRLTNADGAHLPGLCIRTALGPKLPRTSRGIIETESVRDAIAIDLADCVFELLYEGRVPTDHDGNMRGVKPNDVAVLILRNADAPAIQQALRERGIPAVVRHGTSVLDTEAAEQWRLLFYAMARPSDPDRARRAALGWFFRHDANMIAEATDEELQIIQEQLAHWNDVLSRSGVVDLCSALWAESDVVETVLSSYHGDRNMTDLDQLSGLLQRQLGTTRPTPLGLISELDRLKATRGADDDDLLARQVESEAMAVQILTVHRAKGLQFPIVCVPSMWNSIRKNDFYQDPELEARVLAIDRAKPWPTKSAASAREALALHDAIGENLRLLYVAMTRAEHQTIVWWTRVHSNKTAGLTQVLFADRDSDLEVDVARLSGVAAPPDEFVVEYLRSRFAMDDHGAPVSVDEIREPSSNPPRWVVPGAALDLGKLTVANWERRLDASYRRWSFSALTPPRADAPLQVNMEIDPRDESHGDAGAMDELNQVDEGVTEIAHASGETDLPLGMIPGGTEFGTLVHEVLQEVDFEDPNLESAMVAAIRRRARWRDVTVDAETLAGGLRAVLETSLGPLFDGRRLVDVHRRDRLGELNFDFVIGAERRARTRQIGAVLLRHLSDSDAIYAWAQQVTDGLFDDDLCGHLTGSIDLVVRVDPKDGGPARFVLADYKTNVLARPGSFPISNDYRYDRLPVAMVHHHYPMQALLYSVALHRYLRWRLRAYDPDVHFGGVAYLFLRGMVGSSTPTFNGHPNGVYSWRPTGSLLQELSDVLDGKDLA